MARVDEFIGQFQDSNAAPVWDLARRLKYNRKRPKIALIRILGIDSAVVTSPEALVSLWAHQFSEEFSGQVAPVSVTQLPALLAGRKHATAVIDGTLDLIPTSQSGLPATQE